MSLKKILFSRWFSVDGNPNVTSRFKRYTRIVFLTQLTPFNPSMPGLAINISFNSLQFVVRVPLTCTRGSGSPNFAAKLSRAAMSGYWQAKNDLSSPSSCCAVNAVLPLRCFLEITMPGSDGTSTSPVLPEKRQNIFKINNIQLSMKILWKLFSID